MRARLFRSSLPALLLLAGPSGCSSPATSQVSTVAAPAAQGAEGAEADALPELSPVAAPENIVGVATLRAPARTLDTAVSWAALGVDWRALLQASPAAALLPVLDLEAPLDVVVTIDPKVKNRPRTLFAASIGLTSRQAALEAFQSMEMPVEFVEPGVHSVHPSPKTICFVSAALGKAKARLVCGEDRESVELLNPYLTRGNPSDRAGNADLHVEVLAEAPWRLFGDKTQFLKLAVPMMLGEISIGNPDFDAALRDAATALVDEVILALGDLKQLRLDAWLHSNASTPQTNELEIKLGTDFQGSRSWLARSLGDGQSRVGVAPDTFWKLPADATEAVYYSAGNPATLLPAVEVLERVFRSGLNHLGASPAAQQQWPSAFKAAITVPGPLVSARGNVPARLLGAAPTERDNARASFGYTILGIDDPDNRFGALLDQTLRLYEDPTLRKSLTQKYGVDPAKLPKAQSRKGPTQLPESRTYEVLVPPALYAEALEKPGVDAAKLGGAIPLVVVIFRQDRRTWIGFSSYAQLLEERLGALVAPKGPGATLESRAGLDRLRRDTANVAGFWTLAGLQTGASLGQGELAKFLSALPPSELPIVARAYGQAAGPSGELQIHVPAQLFRDIAPALGPKR